MNLVQHTQRCARQGLAGAVFRRTHARLPSEGSAQRPLLEIGQQPEPEEEGLLHWHRRETPENFRPAHISRAIATPQRPQTLRSRHIVGGLQ